MQIASISIKRLKSEIDAKIHDFSCIYINGLRVFFLFSYLYSLSLSDFNMMKSNEVSDEDFVHIHSFIHSLRSLITYHNKISRILVAYR